MPTRKDIRRLSRRTARVFSSKYKREAAARRWLAQNRAAIDAYNAHIERDGVFGDGLRSF